MGIIELLENYKNIRDAEITDFGEHEIAPPTKFFDKIRTLDGDFFRPLSPMLQKGLNFAPHGRTPIFLRIGYPSKK